MGKRKRLGRGVVQAQRATSQNVRRGEGGKGGRGEWAGDRTGGRTQDSIYFADRHFVLRGNNGRHAGKELLAAPHPQMFLSPRWVTGKRVRRIG